MNTETQAANDGEIHDQLESHTEQDESTFVNSLDGEDFDPTAVDNQAEQQALEVEAAAGIVFVGLMTIEQTMKTVVHHNFAFDPQQSESVATKVAPLIVKYGGNPPPWLAKYMDELMAVAAIGMLGISSYMQVKKLNADDIAAAKEKTKQAANDDHHKTVGAAA
ncbi:hypothetical protein L4D09_19660 [Photobacterium makurazakiensis]|uniref:hypothetical protein n=1 Tax=Photobacterium makurazakiensis TaxID=2910234 RepID=UPI003D09991A